MAGDVVVGEFIDTAHAIADDRRTLCILARHLGDSIGRHTSNALGPVERVVGHLLLEQVILGDILHTVHREGAFERRLRARRIMQHSRTRCAVPHIRGFHLLRLASFLIHCIVHLAEHLTGVRVHKEGERRVRQHVLAIAQVVVQQVLHHSQEKRRVGTRAQPNPLVCLACRCRETRVEYDDLCASSLSIKESARPHHARFQHVAVGHKHHVSLLPLPYGVEREHARPAERLTLTVALAHVVAVQTASLRAQNGS